MRLSSLLLKTSAVGLLLFAVGARSALADFNPIELLSSNTSNIEGDGSSSSPRISSSADGSLIVFSSDATNLVPNDDNDLSDIFLVDRSGESNTIARLSVGLGSSEADGDSRNPVLSADGKFVAFESDATNLVAGDDNNVTDIFVYSIDDETIERVSLSFGGGDADGASTAPSISNDGQYVVFQSVATDIVTGDDNEVSDVFRYDRDADTADRASVGFDDDTPIEGDGASRNSAISGDGSLVVFESDATNLVSNDNNDASDVFLRSFADDSITLASISTAEDTGNAPSGSPFISNDGSIVAFQSSASDLVTSDQNDAQDVFVYSIATETVSRISVGRSNQESNGPSFSPTLNSDGQYVLFESAATNLVVFDQNNTVDLFAYDRDAETMTRVSVDSLSREVNAASGEASVNSTGQFIAFSSGSNDYVTGDDNDANDIFLIDTQCLLQPTGVTPQDQDGDSTDDCTDECPLDSAKILAGDCGCGVAETDSDSDSTPDCIDECPSDADKSAAGTCGCGVADEDSNSNGIVDCVEPTSTFRPRKPVAVYRKKKRLLRVIIPQEYPGYRYLIQIRDGNRLVAKKRTRRVRAKFFNLSGTLRVRYQILDVLGGGNSLFSPNTRIKAN
ncbi:MAG: PD40 domain-containing protein [Bdellovibrionales bacterium]|nr:PD40 domain-containing protein [Bdellovibrionales bacterium]